MLSYLVPSESRRRLLALLWQEGEGGSVRHLAETAGVSFAAAHRELALMEQSGLALSEGRGASHCYRANLKSPHARLLLDLLEERPEKRPGEPDEELRGWLRSLGAPLVVPAAELPADVPREVVLARGLRLAHRDATLARVWPVLLLAQWAGLDRDLLVTEAHRLGEKQTLGFFADLAGLLARDPEMRRWAQRLRDRRFRKMRDFFDGPTGEFERQLSERNTPALARKWHFHMNLPLESFRAAFRKFSDA